MLDNYVEYLGNVIKKGYCYGCFSIWVGGDEFKKGM